MSANYLFDGLLQWRETDARVLLDVPGSGNWSYAELVSLSARLAHALQAAGVVAGDRVAVQVAKSPAAMALYLATVRTGGVFLPLNTAYTRAEVNYFLEDAEPAVFVCETRREGEFEGIGATLFGLDGDGNGSLREAADAEADVFDNVERA